MTINHNFRFIILGFLLFLLPPNNHVYGQIPQPVDLKIQNISQETSMWCWAASAQQIIYWLNGSTPNQCELVAEASGNNASDCCNNSGNCNVPGGFQEIQSLILNHGGHYSAIAPPANPTILYNTLAQGNAIILFLSTGQQVGHYVVLRGMAWVNTPYNGIQPVLYINDPMAIYTTPVFFGNLINIWAAAIVVY